MCDIRNRAVRFATGRIKQSTDWQEVQNDLYNHSEFGPWIGNDEGLSISIIREAERNLGDKIPAGYSD